MSTYHHAELSRRDQSLITIDPSVSGRIINATTGTSLLMSGTVASPPPAVLVSKNDTWQSAQMIFPEHRTFVLGSLPAFLVALGGCALIVYVVLTSFSTFAAVAQMGSIQERVMPWASHSKKREKSPATKPKKEVEAEKSKPAVEEKKTSSSVSPPHVEATRMEKLIYTLGVANVAMTVYILGGWPQFFYIWNTPKAVAYISHRWYTFRKQNQHYLLFDFCYWANFLLLLYCWVFPHSEKMFRVAFMAANGPLAWAVLAFTQSLIFHSAPHMASVFIHVGPMLLTYAIRWCSGAYTGVIPGASVENSTNSTDHAVVFGIGRFNVCGSVPGDWPACTESYLGLVPMVTEALTHFYLPWVLFYYLWVFVLMDNRVRTRGYKTLFDRVATKGPFKWLTKFSDNRFVQKAAYMLCHVLFGTFTMVLATAYWQSQLAHLLFCFIMCLASAWNASGFYFTVFLNQRLEAAATAEAKRKQALDDRQ